MRNKTYSFYSDCGHGWLKVPLKDLSELGLFKSISSYSYINGGYAFLEEDCDLSKFIIELEKRSLVFKYRNMKQSNHSRIRSFDRFSEHNAIYNMVQQ